MKYSIAVLLLLLFRIPGFSQDILSAKIIDAKDKKPIANASVKLKGTTKGSVSDSMGIVLVKGVPAGKHFLVISHVGYEEKELEVSFPNTTEITIELEEKDNEEGEIVVTAVRTSRTIATIPTRVEIISGEELEEKANMKPGEIRMLLTESTGIQTQQTSATSYSSSIRIQGLDGRYTQILKDGFPLYAGYSGGLSIMQVTPLDLKQVEIIKGSSSTLYGGGAIAGLVNLVSKTPKDKRELNFMVNGTSAGGLDLNGFYAQKFGKMGITLFAARNSNAPYDPADIGLTAIPKFERYTVNPRFFFYLSDKTTANLGVSYVTENRLGGDMNYIKHDSSGYFEKNTTSRLTTQAELKHGGFVFKNSFNVFNRRIGIPDYFFEGQQVSSFTEAVYAIKNEKSDWIGGIDLFTDNFDEVKQPGILPRDYDQVTIGGFVQNTWNALNWMTIESGLRGDNVNDYGFNLLPRIAVLFRINSHLSSRMGGGLGYKAPTVFTEDAEKIQFQNVLPIDPDSTLTERSAGVNFDINYRTTLFDGALSFSLNNLFFYTQLNKPLILTSVAGGKLEFINANGHMDTRGMETNVKLIYKNFKLFLGYTYADVEQHFNGVKTWNPLSAKHRLNNVLVYEKEGSLKIGAEAYYFSPQKLSDGSMGKSYWLCGLMGEKSFSKFSLFINFENIFDVRQTRFDTIYTGPISDPVFRDIYAPVDGFVINGGVKMRF